MIHIIIGQSGSGKTTFVKKQFLDGKTQIVDGDVPYTVSGKTAALGRYNVGKRTEGTDTLSYSSQEGIKKLLPKLIAEGYENIVMEGDRINSQDMFEFVRNLGEQVKLYLVRCSVLTSIERLRNAGSKISISFVKATKTKARKNYQRFAGIFEAQIVDTEDGA